MSAAGEKTPEAIAAEAAAQAEAGAEAERVAAEAAATIAKTPEELAAEAAAAGVAKPSPPPPKEDWRERRFAKKAAQLDTERARAAALETELAALKAGAPVGASEADIEAEVQRRLKTAVPEKNWNDRMNGLVNAGREKFGAEKFNQSTAQLRSLVDPKDQGEVTQYRAFLAAVDETGSGPELVFELGKDPAKFQEFMDMPALKMAVELTKFAGGLKAEVPLSAMPRPITPVDGKGIHYEAITPDSEAGAKLPIGEWMARREKQARDRGIQ